MRQSFSALVLLAVATTLHCGDAYSQKIDIKGLRLGMTKAEVEANVGQLPLANFTIGGASSKYPLSPTFVQDKLDMFMVFFDADQFDDVLAAVRSKYPKVRCVNSKVANAMGASFTQVRCRLRDTQGALELLRFVSDIETSVLSLTSDRMFRERDEHEKRRQNDL